MVGKEIAMEKLYPTTFVAALSARKKYEALMGAAHGARRNPRAEVVFHARRLRLFAEELHALAEEVAAVVL